MCSVIETVWVSPRQPSVLLSALTGVVTSSAKCFVVSIIIFLHFYQVDVAVNSTMEWSTFWCNFCVSSTSSEGIWTFRVSQTCNLTVSTAISTS